MVKVRAFGAAPIDVRRPRRPLCFQLLLWSSSQGPFHGPSVLHVKRLDAIAHVVLQCRMSHRHAILTPLQAPFVDGLHRVNGPAGQVPAMKPRWAAIKVMAALRGSASDQRCEGTVPVELGPGPLWDVALREFRFVVGQQACNTETL